MYINVIYDIGNIWDMLSAIGTIGAVIVSLLFTWRAYKKNNEPIQGVMMYSQHTYIGVSNGEYLEGVNEEKAIAIKFEGRMRFYNPSDEPKSLTNLNVAVRYRYEGENLVHPLPILKDEKEYITLGPKATRVIDYEETQSITDFPGDLIGFFVNVKDYELIGSNEDLEAKRFKLTV